MPDNLTLEPELPWNQQPRVQVGRLRSHPVSGWRVMIDRTTWIEHDDGSGLTMAEAEAALDALDAWNGGAVSDEVWEQGEAIASVDDEMR